MLHKSAYLFSLHALKLKQERDDYINNLWSVYQNR